MTRFRWWNFLRPARAALPTLLLCAALTGCGSDQGEVSGIVRSNGKPLPFGTIQFLGQDGTPRAARIQPDGSFSVQVPTGEAKVIVCCVDEVKLKRLVSRSGAAQGRSAAPQVANGTLSRIPSRYADWNTSGLTVVIQSGQTVQDFTLTSP